MFKRKEKIKSYVIRTKLISGQFPWDRNEIVTIVSTEPDGDRVLARDSRGNQQLVPKTYLNLLPATVPSVISNIHIRSIINDVLKTAWKDELDQ